MYTRSASFRRNAGSEPVFGGGRAFRRNTVTSPRKRDACRTLAPRADSNAADPDKLVPVADAGGDDVDQDLACGWRRRLVHLEELDGLAERSDPGYSHSVRASAAEVMAAPAG
jgi:hypothetical protein